MSDAICIGYKSRYDNTFSGTVQQICGKGCAYWSYDGCKIGEENKAKYVRTKKELDDFLQKKREENYEKL